MSRSGGVDTIISSSSLGGCIAAGELLYVENHVLRLSMGLLAPVFWDVGVALSPRLNYVFLGIIPFLDNDVRDAPASGIYRIDLAAH